MKVQPYPREVSLSHVHFFHEIQKWIESFQTLPPGAYLLPYPTQLVGLILLRCQIFFPFLLLEFLLIQSLYHITPKQLE